MKNLVIVLGCLLIFSFGFSQDAIHFTMGLLPNNSYNQSVSHKIRIELNLDSSTDALQCCHVDHKPIFDISF
jgi:hypothetical protein